jgi:hypothetical protein
MKITTYSAEDLKKMFLSMAKIGNASKLNLSKPVIPRVNNTSLDAISLPYLLVDLVSGTNTEIQWDYVGDTVQPSKFILTTFTDLGFTFLYSAKILDESFSLTKLTIRYMISIPITSLSSVKYNDFKEVIHSQDSFEGFEKILSFIKEHYKLNDAQEAKLRS